ncbi:myb-related transcription factor, partner of profilin-like isoform X2 [Trichoplusia ni]|uniref:Regulatory protein zeste n=1 Tax=Trichoplusia ni TaxID=7111 RepID=A0A7E5VJB4_TRINI|nr:myb-related transcription factor, partner of profilin-like isoform X2 [Trichoplusia ni]
MESRVRASPEQMTTMLEYMETHGDLARPLAGPQGRVRLDRLWTELANMLNAVGGGVSKTTNKWKKVWADWKSKTKKKALAIRHHARGTGGGPACNQALSASDERVLAIMGALAVSGQGSVEELGFNRSNHFAQDDPVTQDVVISYLEIEDKTPQPSQPSNNLSARQTPLPLVPTPLSAHGRQPIAPSPLAPVALSPPAPAALSPPASPAPSTPRRRRPTVPRASAITPPARRRPRLGRRSPASPQSAASPDRPRLRARRRFAPTPFERAASEFTAVEVRRLELEEARSRRQHERDLRALEVEHERNQVFSSLVQVAQAWLDYYRSRDNTEPVNTA